MDDNLSVLAKASAKCLDSFITNLLIVRLRIFQHVVQSSTNVDRLDPMQYVVYASKMKQSKDKGDTGN